MQAMAPLIRDDASVILTASSLNHVGRHGLSLLSASKAAVRSLARSWARDIIATLEAAAEPVNLFEAPVGRIY